MKNKYMSLALDVAKESLLKGEVPIGCVIVNQKGDIVARSGNKIEKDKNRINHAEMIALQEAITKKTDLRNCDLYVTLRPCPMCAHAIALMRIKRVYIGVIDSRHNKFDIEDFYFHNFANHKPEIYIGIMEEENQKLLTNFFDTIR